MSNPDPSVRVLTPQDLQADAIVAELVRYYALEFIDSGSDVTAPGVSQEIDAAPSLPPGSVRLRDDPTLVAFAQLGTLHLNCQRSFISLIDSKDQYILAEATPSVSLSESTKYRDGENPALGAARIPLSFGVCPLSIKPFVDIDTPNGSTDGFLYLLPEAQDIYFVEDMSQIESYKTRPTVANWPYLKFYAGIPLRTQDGQVIGMYSVTDSRKRDGLSVFEIQKMRELASVIVDHLQLVQFQDRLERSRNMIRGLGRFVDGKAVQQLWQDAFVGQLENLSSLDENAYEALGVTTLSTQSPISSLVPTTVETTTTLFGDISDSSSQIDTMMVSVAATGVHTESLTDALGKGYKREFNHTSYFGNEDASSSAFGSGLGGMNYSEQEALVLQDEDVNVAIKTLFSRASHWIRKACDFDGILFVDASGQDIRPKIDKRGRKMENTASNSTEFSNDYRCDRSCDVLGFSLEPRPRPSVGLPSTVQFEIPQSTLGGLLRKYPRGRVFLFDEEGHLLQTETVENETRKTRKGFTNRIEKAQVAFEKEKDQMEAYQLLDICQGARSIAFFPLWDPHRDQWYAGSLAWSLDPIRVLQHEELMFLGAFGSCVMAEKSKIDMLNADRDKQDFISSVSHELRTPLHGILASVDSLTDLVSEIAQDEMRTIIICGDVLMDTMDHILDYSKMTRNNPKLVKTGGRGKAWQVPTNRAVRLESFDFSKLFENVIEGTVAGFSFRNSSRISQEKPSQVEMYRSTQVTPPNSNHNVMVVLEIEHQISWLYESQIGAWKRILTNAFGNALKYTTAGFVRVALRVNTSSNNSDKHSEILLQIEDSGIGMSKEFLKHGLYAPFVQANPLSVGTGLGLSIVRQLVDDLDGTISIQSEVDFGTQITIKAPLEASSVEELDLTAAGTNTPIRDIAAWCKGLTICFVAFDYYPELDEVPTGILNTHARRMLAIRSSIGTYASDWFGLTVKHCHTLDEVKGDIIVGMFSKLNLVGYTPRPQPLIVFEDVRPELRPANIDGVFYLSQPFGPHKFGRILGLCLEYRSGFPDTEKELDLAASQYLDVISPDVGTTRKPEIENPLSAPLPGPENVSSSRPVVSKSPSYFVPQLIEPSANGRVSLSLSAAVHTPIASPVPEPRSVVLLVEDNAINMRILVNLMNKASQRHHSAINGLEAVHVYQADPQSFKVIFMDISMPVKDGIQATREIRKFEHENSLPRVRIVAVTCFSSAEVQTNAFQSGVDMFALKPMPMRALKPILELDPHDVVPPT